MPEFGDKYKVEKEVGRGGAGRVFLAFDGKVGREVAIKEVELGRLTEGWKRDRARKRFIREVKLTAQLEHPHIVPIYDLMIDEEGATYYVMKYVRGKTLKQAVGECEGSTPEEGFESRIHLLGSLIDVCQAIGYAHSKGIIHRDLKPGNIVLGEFGQTIIIDWGLAKKVADKDEPVGKESISEIFDDGISTRHDTIMGTPSYMAPEQADDKHGSVDERSDVYALGALLFYVLTGERIYEPGGKQALGGLMSDVPTPSPALRSRCIPPELTAICVKATSKNKEERYRDAGEMAAELCAYRDGRIVSTYAYTRLELLKRFISRNKAAAVATLALIVAIIAGAAFSLNFAVEAHHARARAERALVDISAIEEQAMSIVRRGVRSLKAYQDEHGTMPGSERDIPQLLGFDPKDSPFQVWFMRQDGQIVYDEDPQQMGKFLFTDEMYERFPELKRFGVRVQDEPWGTGYYSFYDRSGKRVIYKIAAWDTIEVKEEETFKVIVTHPYDAND